jgi:glycosyltransferase involved in cell wall biosynthesis
VPRSILIVAQHAPPSPLVGARRPAALAKELGRRGFEVYVLTSLASGRGAVPHAARTIRSRDLLTTRLNWRRASLQAQQGSRPGPYREASTLESIVVPDLSVVTWLPFALARTRALIARLRPDCLLTTGPPQSAHLVGPLARRLGAAWIADLRDGWTYDAPHEWLSPALARADRAIETAVLRRADRVVAVTEPITRDLRERLGIDAVTITNGFDPEDEVAGDVDGLVRADRYTIAYTGRLGVAGRKPQALLEAALELRRRRPDMSRPPEIVFAGAIAESEQHLFSDSRYASVARSVGVLERPRALALQRAADALVVIAAGSAGYPAESVATGKLFEYLGALRPVLVLGERTEAARIVAQAGAGLAAPGDEPTSVADALERLLDAPPVPDREAVSAYAWPALAERYEQVIAEVCGRARPPVAPP